MRVIPDMWMAAVWSGWMAGCRGWGLGRSLNGLDWLDGELQSCESEAVYLEQETFKDLAKSVPPDVPKNPPPAAAPPPQAVVVPQPSPQQAPVVSGPLAHSPPLV